MTLIDYVQDLEDKYRALKVLRRLPILPIKVENGKYHYSCKDILRTVKEVKFKSEKTKEVIKLLIEKLEKDL